MGSEFRDVGGLLDGFAGRLLTTHDGTSDMLKPSLVLLRRTEPLLHFRRE